MGSYFEIDEKETNSKAISMLLVDIIKKLRKFNYCKKYFKLKENKDGENYWKISKNGIATLLEYFIEYSWDFGGTWRDYVIEKNKDALEYKLKIKNFSEDEIEKEIEKYEKSMDENIQWIIVYLSRIFCNMTLDKRKIVYGRWV